MKITLSVKEFAMILRLVEARIKLIKDNTQYIIARRRAQENRDKFIDMQAVSVDEIEKEMNADIEYQSLRHLYDALGELQVEVQTPDVEIKDKQ